MGGKVTRRNHPEWMESLYEKLANDEDGRVCEAISDQACREAPGNFFRTLASNTLTSIGDRLASAKTTLPWLLAHLAAPAWCLSLLSLTVAVWSLLDLAPNASRWFYPVAFFGLSIAHAGVRLGRKTYLVDLAEGNRRTDYVAVSNTVIGALLLVSGLISAAAAVFSLEAAIFL